MKITIKNLRASVQLGVHEWEQDTPRNVVMQVMATYDATQCARNDNMQGALDYAKLEQYILIVAGSRHFNMVESMVKEIGEGVMQHFPMVKELVVEIEKPGALRQADAVSVAHQFKR